MMAILNRRNILNNKIMKDHLTLKCLGWLKLTRPNLLLTSNLVEIIIISIWKCFVSSKSLCPLSFLMRRSIKSTKTFCKGMKRTLRTDWTNKEEILMKDLMRLRDTMSLERLLTKNRSFHMVIPSKSTWRKWKTALKEVVLQDH
jgi:hypothetical protein